MQWFPFQIGWLNLWILIVAVAVYWFIGYQWTATLEERFCMEHWPDEFREYKRKVAKNFLFF